MKKPVDEHMEKLHGELKQRFPERPMLLAWFYACLEAKAGCESTTLGQKSALRRLAESDACVDFEEWIEAASEALDDAFLETHADDEAILERGCARIQQRQKRLYPWRTEDLENHRPTYLEGEDLEFPSNEGN